MVLQYCVQSSKFAFRERTKVEKVRAGTAAALLTSFIADADVITDWMYFKDITNRGDDETPIPTWIRTLQLVSCICGTLSWLAISSDGRLVNWLRKAVWGISIFLLMCLGIAMGLFLLIPLFVIGLISRCRRIQIFNYEDMFDNSLNKFNAFFSDGFRISSGGLLMLGIIFEDLPQIVVTFLVEDASGSLFGSDGTISRSAYLNLVLAIFDILHKLAEAWDTRKLYVPTGTGARTFTGHTNDVYSLATVGIDRIVSASHDGTARLWDIVAGKCTKTFDLRVWGWDGTIASLGDDKIITVSSERNGKIKVFSIESGDCLKTIDSGNNACAVASNDGQYVITSKRKHDWNPYEITRWNWDINTETLKRVQTYPKRADYLLMLNDDEFVSANDTEGERGHPILWNVTSGDQIRTFNITNVENRVTAMCKHNTDTFLVASWKRWSYTCIDLFTAGQSNPIKTMTIEGKKDIRLTSVGGNRFVVSYIKRRNDDDGGNTAGLWDISSRACLHTFEGHVSWINGVVYLPEQKSIATASSDSNVKVWSIPNQDDDRLDEGNDNLPGINDIENQQSDVSSSRHRLNDDTTLEEN